MKHNTAKCNTKERNKKHKTQCNNRDKTQHNKAQQSTAAQYNNKTQQKLEKCRKHSSAARLFYISVVFSKASILVQWVA